MKIVISSVLVIFLMIVGFLFYLSRGIDVGINQSVDVFDISELRDGTYIGKYDQSRWTTQVEVTLENGEITNIVILKTVTFERDEVTQYVIDEVLTHQSLEIDSYTGATISSLAYLKAIEDALSKAR